MATFFSESDNNSLALALVAAFNQMHDAVAAGVSGLSPTGYCHRDVTSLPVSADNWQSPGGVPMVVNAVGATGLPASYAVAVDLQGKLLAHFNDNSSHVVPDLVNAAVLAAVPKPLSPSDATGTSSLLTLCQVSFNNHLTALSASGAFAPGQVQVHVSNDGVNSNSTPTAVGTGTAYTLAGSLASGVSAHLVLGPPYGRVKALI